MIHFFRYHKRPPKDKSQMLHAIKRARERFDLVLSPQEYHELIRMIQNKEGNFLGRESNRVTHWQLEFKHISFRVCYDTMRHQIISFLPLES